MAGYVSSGTNDLFDYLKVVFGHNPYAVKHNLYDIKSVIYHSGYAHVADSLSCTETGYDGYEFTENDIAILELRNQSRKQSPPQYHRFRHGLQSIKRSSIAQKSSSHLPDLGTTALTPKDIWQRPDKICWNIAPPKAIPIIVSTASQFISKDVTPTR